MGQRAGTAWEDGSVTDYGASAYAADWVACRLERRGLWDAAERLLAVSISYERWRRDVGLARRRAGMRDA